MLLKGETDTHRSCLTALCPGFNVFVGSTVIIFQYKDQNCIPTNLRDAAVSSSKSLEKPPEKHDLREKKKTDWFP